MPTSLYAMPTKTKHLGVMNTMATVKEGYLISHLSAKVKKVINDCKRCKAFRAQPYGPAAMSLLPSFQTEGGRPFKTTGIDFAGPITYKISKKEQSECYMLIFTCAMSRALHVEVTKSQRVEEFKEKLNFYYLMY